LSQLIRVPRIDDHAPGTVVQRTSGKLAAINLFAEQPDEEHAGASQPRINDHR
jgi:hypothetical protein